MHYRIKIYLTAVAICSLLLLPAAGFAGKPGFDDKEVRIGQWSPQTGPAAAWGNIARGSRLLFNMVNEEGGIHGRRIKYYLRDDQYNPTRTKAVVKELVEKEGIFAFVGGTSTAGGLAVKDYLAQNNVIWVGPATSAREFAFPLNPYIFAVMPLYEDEASVLTRYLVDKKKFRKIGFVYQNDAYGKSGLEGCRQRLDFYGMKTVVEIPVEAAAKDLASQVMKLKNSGAEAVFLWVNPTSAVIALKSAAAIGYKPQWVTSVTLADFALMHKISNGLWEGVIAGSCTEPVASPLVTKYRNAAKRLDPSERWAFLYMAGIFMAEPLVDALKRTGRDLSTEACLKALNSTKNFKGVGSRITWSARQHQGSDSIQIWQCGPNGSVISLQGWTANDLATWKRKK